MLINIFVRGLVLKKRKKRLHIGYICWCNQDWEHFEQIKKTFPLGLEQKFNNVYNRKIKQFI